MRSMTSRLWLAAPGLAVALVAAAACGSGSGPDVAEEVGRAVEVEGGTYVNVTPQELDSIRGEQDVLLVNVHIPYEGEISGTDKFIPFDRIGEYVDELPADSDSKIVLYCRSGNMSDTAARALVSLGYTNVWNLDGGMIAWEAAGYPLDFTDR